MNLQDAPPSVINAVVDDRSNDGGSSTFADLNRRLANLSGAAAALSINLTSEDLKHRCDIISQGAKIASGLLLQLPAAMAARQLNEFDASNALGDTRTEGTETKLLCKLGWLAMELGLHQEALSLLQAVGTLLHGRLGGSIFKLESLLAIGRLKDAADLYRSEILDVDGVDFSADAIFDSLWSQRGATLWSGMKMRANQGS